MLSNNVKSYFCGWCKTRSSTIDKDGVAECPVCKRKRDDGLNQIDNDHFECMKCKGVFFVQSSSNPVCPNDCHGG